MVGAGTRSSSSRQRPSKSTNRSAANALHRNCGPLEEPRPPPRSGMSCGDLLVRTRIQFPADAVRGQRSLRKRTAWPSRVGHLGCSSMQCCEIRSSPPSGRLNLLNGQQTCTAIDRNSRSAFADRPSTTCLHGEKQTRSCRIGKIAPSARRIAPAPVSRP